MSNEGRKLTEEQLKQLHIACATKAELNYYYKEYFELACSFRMGMNPYKEYIKEAVREVLAEEREIKKYGE